MVPAPGAMRWASWGVEGPAFRPRLGDGPVGPSWASVGSEGGRQRCPGLGGGWMWRIGLGVGLRARVGVCGVPGSGAAVPEGRRAPPPFFFGGVVGEAVSGTVVCQGRDAWVVRIYWGEGFLSVWGNRWREAGQGGRAEGIFFIKGRVRVRQDALSSVGLRWVGEGKLWVRTMLCAGFRPSRCELSALSGSKAVPRRLCSLVRLLV